MKKLTGRLRCLSAANSIKRRYALLFFGLFGVIGIINKSSLPLVVTMHSLSQTSDVLARLRFDTVEQFLENMRYFLTRPPKSDTVLTLTGLFEESGRKVVLHIDELNANVVGDRKLTNPWTGYRTDFCKCLSSSDESPDTCCELVDSDTEHQRLTKKSGTATYQRWAKEKGYAPFSFGNDPYENRATEEAAKSRGVSEVLLVEKSSGQPQREPFLLQLGGTKNFYASTRGVDKTRPVVFHMLDDTNICHHFTHWQVPLCILLRQEGFSGEILIDNEDVNGSQRWILNVFRKVCKAKLQRGDKFCLNSSKKEHGRPVWDVCGRNASYPAGLYYEVAEVTARGLYHFSHFGVPVPRPNQVLDIIRQRMHDSITATEIPLKSPWYVLLALRRTNRILVDSITGGQRELIAAFRALRMPLMIVEIGSLGPEEQVRVMSEAAVVVAVHGGDCTNIAFMQRNTHFIEVTLRYGWCCDPVPPNALDVNSVGHSGICSSCSSSSRGCGGEAVNDCKPYHKADYFNQALASNLSWSYFDPEYLDPSTGANPIDRDYVYVNSHTLARAALLRFVHFVENH